MEQNEKINVEKEISIMDYLRVVVRWRRLIFYNTIGLGIFAFLVSLILPNVFISKAVMLPPEETQDVLGVGFGLSTLLGGKIPSGGGLGKAFGLPIGATLSDIFAVILKSHTVMEGVVKKNDLIRYYKLGKIAKKKPDVAMENAILKLKKATKIDVSAEGIITVAVSDKGPRKAAEIANSYIEELDRFNKEINVTQAKNTRIFIEERLVETKKEVEKAETSLREFQEKNKTVSITEETKAAIEGVAKLKAEIISREVQLGVLKGYATEKNPQVVQLKSEILSLRNRMRAIEEGKGSSNPGDLGYGAGFAVPFSKLPAVGIQLAKLMRDVKIQETLLSLLTEQYERAKINEARDTPTVRILDRAIPPVKKSKPKRMLYLFGGIAFGFFASLFFSFFLEYAERVKGREDEYKEWQRFGREIIGDFEKIKNRFLRKK